MKQSGFAPILILPFVLIGLVFVYGVYWYTGSIINAPQATKIISTPTTNLDSTPSSKPLDDISSEINDFPIYPNAKFVKKEVVPPCKEPYSGYSICNATTYSWEINEKLTKVLDWYQNNNSGWKMSGGAGDVSDEGGGGVEAYKKEDKTYRLHYSADPNLTTIILEIPLGSPEGN